MLEDMSTRLLWFHGAADGWRQDFLSGPLPSFLEWYSTLMGDESLHGPAERQSVVDLLQRILIDKDAALLPANEDEARILDLMLDAYHGHFCDYVSEGVERVASEALLRWQSYLTAQARVEERCGMAAGQRWRDAVVGQSGRIGAAYRCQPIEPGDEFRVIHLTSEEVRVLAADLTSFHRPWPFSDDMVAWAIFHAQDALNNLMKSQSGAKIVVV